MICPHCHIAGGLLSLPFEEEEPKFICGACRGFSTQTEVEAYNRYHRVPVKRGRRPRSFDDVVRDVDEQGKTIELFCRRVEEKYVPNLELDEARLKFVAWQHREEIERRLHAS